MSNTVVIAGAGPTGLMLACELGLAGVETVVVERRAEPSAMAPGMAINMCTAELLDQRGLLDPLRPGTFPLPGAHFSLFWMGLETLSGPHEDAIAIAQARLERVLAERAVALGVDIRRGHDIAGIEQEAAGVTVSVRSAPSDYRLTCSYLVGCDGEDSTVRKLTGIGFPGTPESVFSGLIGDVEVDMGDLVDGQLGAFYCPAGGLYTGAPLGPSTLRVTTAEFDADPPGPDVPATLDQLRDSIRRLTGSDLKVTGLRWLSRWHDVSGHAERYREGGVFLAGDAAHVYFPLGGLRLNTGIHDAVNLGWKLAADLNGWAPPGLLDTYQQERYPVNSEAHANAQAQLALMCPPKKIDPLRDVFGQLLRFEDVRRHLTEIVTGLNVRYPMRAGSTGDDVDGGALLGRRLPHAPLMTADGESSVGQILRSGRGVALNLSGRAALDEVSGWADRVDVVSARPVPEIDAAALLLRPDGHVAWADVSGDDTEGLRAALSRWFGEPAP